MSTPRTDAVKIRCGFQAVPEPMLKHAQELERENATLRAQCRVAWDSQAFYKDESLVFREDKERLDWLEASNLWPASLDFWPHHLPQVGGSLRAAIDAAMKEAQP